MTNKARGYLGNQNLKEAGIDIQFTEEQVIEYMKCAKDPVYFIEKYVKVVSLDEGLVPFKLYDFQEDMVQTVHNNRFTIAKLPRQSGKCFFDADIRVRNKETGEIKIISIENLYKSIKSPDNQE